MTITGAINFTENPPDLQRALRAMALGSGKPRLHRAPLAMLGLCDEAELATTERVTVLVHGRLDAVTDPDLPCAGRSAPDIVIDAYRRWAEDFPQRLIGDFAARYGTARHE